MRCRACNGIITEDDIDETGDDTMCAECYGPNSFNEEDLAESLAESNDCWKATHTDD